MDHLEVLRLLFGGPEGIAEWNQRFQAREEIPSLHRADLSEADLSGAVLSGVNLSGAILSAVYLGGADLSRADLSEVNLSGANLSAAVLTGAVLTGANLSGAVLRAADLGGVDLSRADLCGANLTGAYLRRADLREADLSRADLSRVDLALASFSKANLRDADLKDSCCDTTTFAAVNLSEAKGLESIKHGGPSTVGIDTLFLSKGRIPEQFLRGCGVPEYLIDNQKALIGAIEPIQFCHCFISYCDLDEDFAKRLHCKMRDEGLRVWFVPEKTQSGNKVYEQVDEAVRVFDKLLVVLSPSSINSKWVRDNILRARRSEIQERRRKLFPVRLMDYEEHRKWERFYADLAQDMVEEIQEYYIPDFSYWQDHGSFDAAFARLLIDLKSEESAGPGSHSPHVSRRKKPR